MFLGVGGSGKSSVLDGLMNKKRRTAESTALADTLNIRYHWVEAADAAEEAWKLVQEEDELEEVASLSRKVLASKTKGTGDEAKAEVSMIKKWATTRAVLFFAPVLATIAVRRATASDYSRKATEILSEMTPEIIQRAQRQGETSHLDKGRDVVMHIWDCGGQQVFLDILSAFLTPPTMFIQVFNASQPLNSKYLESWRHNGRTYPGKEQNITILKHMMQWMQLIHASLVEKKEGTPANEASRDGATVSKKQESGPKIIIVGTHGDQLALEDKTRVLNELESSCKGMAFNDIVILRLVVDNTTAGKGKAKEDPGYQNIRKEISKFAHSLSIPTPIAWVSFRKVLQKSVDSNPILLYEQIIPIAKVCGIPKSVVPSLLRFYHEMGVFLHYTSIMLLSTTVIIDPQWLIKQLCKILMPEWYSDRPEGTKNLWQFLETYGILVEPLYHELWRDCGLRGGAQAIVDLLDHFDLAKKITSVPREVERQKGKKYFIPCMLKNLSQENVKAKKREQSQRALKEAATLHIKFNTEYVPPGFFVRLAAHLTESKKCKPLFELGTHRNYINFSYNEIDRVTISESLSGASIQVDMMRVAKRTPLLNRFADSCLAFRNELFTICNEVKRWMPSIEYDFAFKCSCSATEVEHFALIDGTMHRLSSVCCHIDRECEIKSEHKCWLQPSPLKRKPYVEDGRPETVEIKNIVKAIEGNLSLLARVMEIDHDPETARVSEYAFLLEWVMDEDGTRYKLAEYLSEAGLTDISTKLLAGDMMATHLQYSTNEQDFQEANMLQKHDRPTLKHLIDFPLRSSDESLNIIKKIAKKVDDLGIFLLDYETTISLKTQFNNDLERTTKEVLYQWIQGHGKKPVTWSTFIQVLRKMDFSVVADDIEDSLT